LKESLEKALDLPEPECDDDEDDPNEALDPLKIMLSENSILNPMN